MSKKILDIVLKILNILFIGLIVGLIIIGIFRPDIVELFLKWLEGKILLIGNWNYLIAFTSSIVESFPVLGVFFPGQQIMLAVGGFFGKYNLAPIIIVCIIGALIGNYTGYILGVYFGENFLKKYGDWLGIGKTELKILKKQIKKNGAWFIIFGKFHNFTRAFIPFIAGSMGMKQKHFWLYNIIGSISWAITIIILGVVFVQYYKKILDNISYILIGIIIFVVLYIFFFKKKEFKEYLKEKNEEIDEKINNNNL
ncbi:DedA family protein [Candidatus Gracilibacteria bacterium]|nr:DedA family protein [Candidatus Gracilibacteria bacterium]